MRQHVIQLKQECANFFWSENEKKFGTNGNVSSPKIQNPIL